MSSPLEMHVHGMTITTLLNNKDVALCMAEYMHMPLVMNDWGRHGYKQHWSIGDGLVNVYCSNNRDDVSVQITGQASEYLGIQKMIDIYLALDGRASRSDAAVDGCPFDPIDIKNHIDCGYGKLPQNVRTKANRKSFHWNDKYDGQGLNIGSRKSKRYARIYNKNVDENGNNFTRFELELKGNAADLFMQELVKNRDCLQDVFIGTIRSFIDFLEPSEEKNISRIPLADFWQKFVNSVEKLEMKITKLASSTLETVLKHSVKNASNFFVTISTLISAYEISFEEACGRLAKVGYDSRKEKHGFMMKVVESCSPDELKAML